jgi:methylase of polypeptide subunit release factors
MFECHRVFANTGMRLQPEKDRMDIYHKLFLVARRDQLHQAPIPRHGEARILDLGCGTGIWAIDMAE